MKSSQLFFSLFIFATLGVSAQNYSQHFPHHEKIIFLYKHDSDTLVNQMIFDSSYTSNQDISGNGKRLFFTGQRHLLDCPQFPFSPPIDFDGFFSGSDIGYYRFIDSGDIFRIENMSSLLVEIQTSLEIGDSHHFANRALILVDKFWYNENGIQDSVLYFLPSKNGQADFTQSPVIFGKTRGWINGGQSAPFQQVGRIDDNGSYIGAPIIPTWHDYFPEEAGDMKRWQILKAIPPDPSYPIGRVDSFLSVTRYTDSIRVKILQYTLLSDWTWQFRADVEYTIFPPKDLITLLQPENFGRYWLPVADQSSNTDPVTLNRIRMNRSDEIMDIDVVFDGVFSIEDSCILSQVSDAYSLHTYSKQYGLTLKDHNQWGYNTEILIAAKIGTNQFGNLSLSLDQPIAPALSLYPNPTNSNLRIQHEHLGLNYEILDLAGSKVSEGQLTENSLSVGHLEAGCYILRLIASDGTFKSAKFIKQN